MKVYRFLIIFILFFTSCSQKHEVIYDHGKYLPIEYANGFTIKDYGNYKLLTVRNPWQNANNVEYEYIVVDKSIELDKNIVGDRLVIYTPVERVVCMSTTHIGLISLLDEEESVVGTSGLKYVSNQIIRERAANGLIEEIGYEQNVNYETLLNLKPNLLITYGIGSEISGIVNKLKELNVPVVLNADYLENLPLGKAEWIKFIALFYNKDSVANEKFKEIENNYNRLKSLIKWETVKPKVLVGLSWKGTWYVPGGNSFFANFISDAGGEYLWKNNSNNESLPFSIETIFEQASSADFWLNIGNLQSAEEILNVDSRLRDLTVFKSGNLYNNNFRLNEEGGNDYWESGIAHPDEILQDLIRIFHPDALPNHELVYYRKLK